MTSRDAELTGFGGIEDHVLFVERDEAPGQEVAIAETRDHAAVRGWLLPTRSEKHPGHAPGF